MKKEKPTNENQMYIDQAQQQLASHLGRKVKITSGKKKGRLELEFYNVDDLNNLLEQLGQLPQAMKNEE